MPAVSGVLKERSDIWRKSAQTNLAGAVDTLPRLGEAADPAELASTLIRRVAAELRTNSNERGTLHHLGRCYRRRYGRGDLPIFLVARTPLPRLGTGWSPLRRNTRTISRKADLHRDQDISAALPKAAEFL